MTTVDDRPLRVLLCDDDVELSHALVLLIKYNRTLALVSTPVRTGRGAVEGVDLHHPDVVLMDVDLLGPMDGYQATVLIKQRSPATNVVILSGVSDVKRGSTNAHDAGAFAFLPKSCSSAEILDALRAAGEATRRIEAITPG
jgi:DNA-binding NarL/FixJ family response regulator